MLKLENISKYYYSNTSVTCALRKINLEFKVGEFVAITGESGSGKTTLLNILSGLDSYEDGELYYYEKQTSYFDASDWEKYRKEEISFIFQNYNLIDSYTVLENVMVAYIIEGVSYKEAKIKSKDLLKFVGLNEHYNKKAAKLSGGQKQRLSIARALAKNTNIIVADEPTGNLDNENALAVLELLKKISKDKLIIVVTHNLAQIEPFISRKIRLHDGEVVLDEMVNNVNQLISKESKIKIEENYKTIFNFSFLNLKSQPKKSIFLFLLILISTLSSFIFYGNFKMNLDDNRTKYLDDSIFTNFDETRLIVKNNDSTLITEEQLIDAKVKNVECVEKYDYITDINYYRENEDYEMIYSGGEVFDPITNTWYFVDNSSIKLLNHSHFMRSSYGLTDNMLKVGRLPTNDYEMIVYSDDLSVLNTKEIVLFRNEKLWGIDKWYEYEVKIVGILKDYTKQVYFSDDLCKIMNLTQYNLNVSVVYYEMYNGTYRMKSYTFKEIVVDPNLKEDDISFKESIKEELKNSMIKEENNTIINSDIYSCKFNLENNLEVSDSAIGVSKSLFEKIYQQYVKNTQFAVFVKDYAYIDEVQDSLAKKGFDSISCFRASTNGYDTAKVISRYVNLFISLCALVIVNLIVSLLCLTILRVKKNDYLIFKLLGLSNNNAKKINYLELLYYGILSNILLVLIALIVKNNTTSELIIEMFKYIKFYDYIFIFILTIILSVFTGKKFSSFLNKKIKVTMLKEE